MTELEQYIREHAASFDTEAPAEGHEARFLSRLDVTPLPSEDTRPAEGSVTRRPRTAGFRPFAWAFALAAVAAALLVFRPGTPRHFFGVPNNPERVYRSYLAQVEKAYLHFPWEDGYDWEGALDELTEESVSLFEQLPEELPARQQARILKAYYGDILDGVKQLKNR
jgi:hypothetical protein